MVLRYSLIEATQISLGVAPWGARFVPLSPPLVPPSEGPPAEGPLAPPLSAVPAGAAAGEQHGEGKDDDQQPLPHRQA